MESNGSGVWFNVTVIPASVVGSGMLAAFTGCEERTVFKPVTNSVVIWPGATLMTEGSLYPAPTSVGPCPNIGTRLMMIAQAAMGILRRMVHSSVDLNEPTGRERHRPTDRILPLCSDSRRWLESGPVASDLLSGGFRSGLCGSRGRLLWFWRSFLHRRFLNWRSLFRRLCRCRLHRRLLRSGFRDDDWFCLRFMKRSPSLFRGLGDGFPSSSTHLALRFCRGCFGRQFGFALRCGPPFALCITDALPGGCTHLPAFALGGFQLGCGWLGGTTGKHGSEFCDLGVDMEFLLFKADDGGVDYFGSEFGRHVRCSF